MTVSTRVKGRIIMYGRTASYGDGSTGEENGHHMVGIIHDYTDGSRGGGRAKSPSHSSLDRGGKKISSLALLGYFHNAPHCPGEGLFID